MYARVGGMTAAAIVAVLGLATIAGCQRSPKFVPVEGNVTLDSKPLGNATVVLSPTRASAPGPFVGTTDHEGHFALASVSKERAGAMPATYFVLITTVRPDPKNPDGPPMQKEIVPPPFNDGSKRFDVPAGGTKEANFNIKSSLAK